MMSDDVENLAARIERLERRVTALEGGGEGAVAAGDKCPRCGRMTYRTVSTKPHRTLGVVGVKDVTRRCEVCEFEDTDVLTPD